MGNFLQQDIRLESTDQAGVYKTLTDLTFYSSKMNCYMSVYAGYITDGFSIPQLFETITGGRWEQKSNMPAVLHDSLCQKKGYTFCSEFHPVTFKQANDLFDEAMKACGFSWLKRIVFRAAVELNVNRW